MHTNSSTASSSNGLSPGNAGWPKSSLSHHSTDHQQHTQHSSRLSAQQQQQMALAQNENGNYNYDYILKYASNLQPHPQTHMFQTHAFNNSAKIAHLSANMNREYSSDEENEANNAATYNAYNNDATGDDEDKKTVASNRPPQFAGNHHDYDEDDYETDDSDRERHHMPIQHANLNGKIKVERFDDHLHRSLSQSSGLMLGKKQRADSSDMESVMSSKREKHAGDSMEDLAMNGENGGAAKHAKNGGSAQAGKSDLICVVCGAQANGYNFDRITCESCKAFFRRNAFRPLVIIIIIIIIIIKHNTSFFLLKNIFLRKNTFSHIKIC